MERQTHLWSAGRPRPAKPDSTYCFSYSATSPTNDAHAVAPAQFLDTAHKNPVWHHIIAFGFHHHHEIALPLHIEQHLGFALALVEQRVQGIDRAIVRAPQRNSNSQCLRQWHVRFVERSDFVGGDLRICSFFNAHAAANQHWHFLLQLLRQPPVSLGKYEQLHLPPHVFKGRLRP